MERILPVLRRSFGREIEIFYEPAPDLEPGVRTGNSRGRFVVPAVGDSGPGMDDESWAHLLEPFSGSCGRTAGGSG